MNIPYNVSCFWKEESRQINTARINHFNSLGLDIKDKCILETGCGGCGDFTINLLNEYGYHEKTMIEEEKLFYPKDI